jgi:hypothetical protein
MDGSVFVLFCFVCVAGVAWLVGRWAGGGVAVASLFLAEIRADVTDFFMSNGRQLVQFEFQNLSRET